MSVRRRLLPAAVAICCLLGLAVLAGVYAAPDGNAHYGAHSGAAAASEGTAPAPAVLSVGNRGCLPGIGGLRSGRNTLRIRNTGNSPQEVMVLDGQHRYAYGELEMIAPGTTRQLVVVLPPGPVGVSCEADDGTVSYSDPVTVTGPKVTGVHSWIPATQAELGNVITHYRASVIAGLTRLASDTDKLQAATSGHDRAVIKQRWLTAHLDYERLGAAYDTFGDYADKINGLPNGLPAGVHDRGFTGFHKIEYLLWHDGSDAQIADATQALDRDVHKLVKAFPHQLTQPNDVPLRSHEVLENSLQFTLTGQDDLGSHSGLATLSANIDGTRMTLKALTPLLEQKDPELLSSARHAVADLSDELAGLTKPDGSWPALSALGADQKRQLDGALAATLESLAPIPTELEVLTTHDNS